MKPPVAIKTTVDMLVDGTWREAGHEFEASRSRADVLVQRGHAIKLKDRKGPAPDTGSPLSGPAKKATTR